MEKIVFNLTDDYEGKAVASLFSYKADNEADKRCSILYIHGYVDYFFQKHVAQFFNSKNFNFYALELRKYGSSYLGNQHFNYCRDLSEYFEEIDKSIDYIISQSAGELTLIGHSTGGLLSSLYAARGDRRHNISKLVLNSPFLELNTSWINRKLASIVAPISKIFPYISKKNEIRASYFDSIHTLRYGEWSFNATYKPRGGIPLYFAWLWAVILAQKEVKKGLNIKIPILVLSSDKSSYAEKYCEEVAISDAVLNVEDIAKYSKNLGCNVELFQVKDALHDVFLSNSESRRVALERVNKYICKIEI